MNYFYSVDHQAWGLRLDGETDAASAARIDAAGHWDKEGPVSETMVKKAPHIFGLHRAVARHRVARILDSEAAKISPSLASHLAFETDMPVADAVRVLNVDAAGRK